jgi:hypothetical protein
VLKWFSSVNLPLLIKPRQSILLLLAILTNKIRRGKILKWLRQLTLQAVLQDSPGSIFTRESDIFLNSCYQIR